jgi:hypothetical protein
MGSNHFFALFTVITSLGLGGSPVGWGLILDVIGSFEAVTGAFYWRRHSIYFVALLVLNAMAFVYIPRLHESRASSVTTSLFSERLKRFARFWHR